RGTVRWDRSEISRSQMYSRSCSGSSGCVLKRGTRQSTCWSSTTRISFRLRIEGTVNLTDERYPSAETKVLTPVPLRWSPSCTYCLKRGHSNATQKFAFYQTSDNRPRFFSAECCPRTNPGR